MARPKKTESENTKDNIFKCSVELFMKYGYEGASMRDIAKACGIKESSLYHYFKSKEHLLNSIYDFMDDFLEKSAPSEIEFEIITKAVDPIKFFEEFFLSYSSNHNEITNEVALFIMKEDFRNERAKKYVVEKNCRDMADLIRNILEKYKGLGKINKACDCEFIAHELNYYYLGMLTEWTHLKYEEQDDTYLRERLKRHVNNALERYVV